MNCPCLFHHHHFPFPRSFTPDRQAQRTGLGTGTRKSQYVIRKRDHGFNAFTVRFESASSKPRGNFPDTGMMNSTRLRRVSGVPPFQVSQFALCAHLGWCPSCTAQHETKNSVRKKNRDLEAGNRWHVHETIPARGEVTSRRRTLPNCQRQGLANAKLSFFFLPGYPSLPPPFPIHTVFSLNFLFPGKWPKKFIFGLISFIFTVSLRRTGWPRPAPSGAA
jgi:hypothetical protein